MEEPEHEVHVKFVPDVSEIEKAFHNLRSRDADLLAEIRDLLRSIDAKLTPVSVTINEDRASRGLEPLTVEGVRQALRRSQ